MNKLAYSPLRPIYLLLCFFFLTISTQAQIDLNAYSNGYIQINSYTGASGSNFTRVQVNLHGDADLVNWTLSAHFPSPIIGTNGARFPVDKLKMRINHIEGTMQGSTPTISALAADTNLITMQITEVPLIRNSPFRLYTPRGNYNQLKIVYDFVVEGGAYLQEFDQQQIRNIPCVITLRNASGGIVHQTSFNNYELQFMLNGSPPIENTYSIETSVDSRNSFLEFRTLSDYANGAQVRYEKALKVTSSTPYSIQVRSTSDKLSSNRSDLPISIVQLSIIDNNSFSTLNTIGLSNVYQTLYNSNKAAKKPVYFDLKYATKPRDERLLQVRPDTYSGTLIYTLTPQ